MTNLYIIVFVLAAICGAALYIYRQKKIGAACVGCPHAKECGSKSGCCAEHKDDEE